MWARHVAILALVALGAVTDAAAGCDAVHGGQWAYRPPVDLISALRQPFQAGGEIAVAKTRDGKPFAYRCREAPRDQRAELARRHEAFAVFRKVNVAEPGEVGATSLALSEGQIALLERFAMSDAGAVWMRAVVDDTIRLFNRGYLEARPRASAKASPRFSEMITGRLSENGLFANDIEVFKVYAFAGPGAVAQPGSIGLGTEGIKSHFPFSGEAVDRDAILSHEFGHTRYGDPASGSSIVGEAQTVELYENPVRVANGYEPRTVYYYRDQMGSVDADDLDRVFSHKRKILVNEFQVVDEYHCDCGNLLPVEAGCDVRRANSRQNLFVRVVRPECFIRLKPDV